MTFSITLTLTFLSLTVFGQSSQSELKFNGRLKSVSRTTYHVKDDTITDSVLSHLNWYFDSNKKLERKRSKIDNKTRDEVFFSNKKNQDTCILIYKDGVLSEKIRLSYSDSFLTKKIRYDVRTKSLISTINFIYNENGQIRYEEQTISDIGNFRYELNYDTSGFLIQELWFGKQGGLESVWTIMYDSLGNETENIEVNIEEKYLYHDIFQYNAFGHWVNFKELSIDNELVLEKSWSYIYDENGNWTTCKLFVNGKFTRFIEQKLLYY